MDKAAKEKIKFIATVATIIGVLIGAFSFMIQIGFFEEKSSPDIWVNCDGNITQSDYWSITIDNHGDPTDYVKLRVKFAEGTELHYDDNDNKISPNPDEKILQKPDEFIWQWNNFDQTYPIEITLYRISLNYEDDRSTCVIVTADGKKEYQHGVC